MVRSRRSRSSFCSSTRIWALVIALGYALATISLWLHRQSAPHSVLTPITGSESQPAAATLRSDQILDTHVLNSAVQALGSLHEQSELPELAQLADPIHEETGGQATAEGWTSHWQATQRPHITALSTQWGEHPEMSWREYPRPELQRGAWTSLNGLWNFRITPIARKSSPFKSDVVSGSDVHAEGTILVPFPLESNLSGVQRILQPREALWYQRSFRVHQLLPRSSQDTRMFVNFEAVDYYCQVMVNGMHVQSHKGGSTPFRVEITDVAKRMENNEVVVRVEDTMEGAQLRGKQTRNPNSIWYTGASGIWQSVWLEVVGVEHIERLEIETSFRNAYTQGVISVRPLVSFPTARAPSGLHVKIAVLDRGRVMASTSGELKNDAYLLTVDSVVPWSPTAPHLYDLHLHLTQGDRLLDQVRSYIGVREVGTERNAQGHLQFTLNGKTIFHWGPLDQGWWPDGLLSPPSDEAMVSDIRWLKKAGFNMIRKHIKIEPRRYYYHCDKLGMLVWQDQPSVHNEHGFSPDWTYLRDDPQDASWQGEDHTQFMQELDEMMTRMKHHPSVVVWVPFNEAWGQHETGNVAEFVSKRDPSRHINIASGGNFFPVGHIVDMHNYPSPMFPQDTRKYDSKFVKVVGEFGGHGFVVNGHLWADGGHWGYGDVAPTQERLLQRYEQTLKELGRLRRRGIAAAVYTQTTDVEKEVNGLLTYDRRVEKISAEKLSSLANQYLEL